MTPKAVAAVALVAALGGCASPPPTVERVPRVSERIVLLPSDSDRPSAIVVKSGPTEILIDAAYGRVDLRGNELTAGTSTAAEVERRYGGLLAAQPKKPQPYTMYFVLGTDELTPHSKAAFEEARKQIASWSAVEVVVIGHTDRLGAEEHNNKLSMQRAQMIAKRLVMSGVPSADIAVAARGEYEPLIRTLDGVAEPRNRRVEIKVR